MTRPSSISTVILVGWAVTVTGAVQKSGYEYVDPFIGTTNGGEYNCRWTVTPSPWRQSSLTRQGHVFPGATLPFGE